MLLYIIFSQRIIIASQNSFCNVDMMTKQEEHTINLYLISLKDQNDSTEV